MSQPTTMIRWALASALFDALRAHPSLSSDATTYVGTSYPGENQRQDSMWLGGIDGAVSIPVFKGGARVTREDDFTLTIYIKVLGRDSDDEANARVYEMVGAIEDVWATNPDLGGFAGLEWAEISHVRTDAIVTDIALEGWAEVTISANSRLN